MDNLFFAADGSASALASLQQYALGILGVVRFDVGTNSETAIRKNASGTGKRDMRR